MRTSRSQYDSMLTYMEKHGDFTKLLLTSGQSRQLIRQFWEELVEILNKDITGDSKSIFKWQKVWSDFKNNIKKKFKKKMIRGEPLHMSSLENRVLKFIGMEDPSGPGPGKAGASQVPKPVLPEKVNIFRQSCINLVKVHNRPLDLFDDEAFRKIVGLLSFGIHDVEYKINFSSERVKVWIDSDDLMNEDGNDEDSDNDNDSGTDGPDLEEMASTKDIDIKISVLKSEVPTCSCSNKSDDGDVRHAVDCLLAANQPYWGYFEVSLDDATCTICHEKLHWNNLSELKSHLQTKHQGVKYKDDDDSYFEEQSSLKASSQIEELYLNEDSTEPATAPTTKKRKIDKVKSKEMPKRVKFVKLNSKNEIPIPKRLKLVKLNNKTEIPIESFKVLDRFGFYVSGLLATLPADRCRKVQLEFVDRLLQEQAAAG